MKRRNILLAGTLLGLQGCRYGPVMLNTCHSGLPDRLTQDPLVVSALEGLDPRQLWDGHVHLLGTGDSDSGNWVNPHMQQLVHPAQYLRFRFYLNAACASADAVDGSYLDRLLQLHAEMPVGTRLLLLAFDYCYDENGQRQEKLSAFHTPNKYAARVARVHPQSFEWIASIHPYREDSVEAVYAAADGNARAVKWLPPAMGINPGSPLCDPFYAALKTCDLPLLVHAGEEKAVHGAMRQDYANPLLLRRPLDQGVKVIVAHCASLGSSADTDRPGKKQVSNFELFGRLMDEKKYTHNLYGEISAMTQVNRIGPALETLLLRQDWHSRLVNASDYPLPAVMPLFSLRKMVRKKYLGMAEAKVLGEVRSYNALLFDLLLKRMLRFEGRRFQDIVFASRRVFDPAGSLPKPGQELTA